MKLIIILDDPLPSFLTLFNHLLFHKTSKYSACSADMRRRKYLLMSSCTKWANYFSKLFWNLKIVRYFQFYRSIFWLTILQNYLKIRRLPNYSKTRAFTGTVCQLFYEDVFFNCKSIYLLGLGYLYIETVNELKELLYHKWWQMSSKTMNNPLLSNAFKVGMLVDILKS